MGERVNLVSITPVSGPDHGDKGDQGIAVEGQFG